MPWAAMHARRGISEEVVIEGSVRRMAGRIRVTKPTFGPLPAGLPLQKRGLPTKNRSAS
jgi:hypothetical protein